MSYGHREQHLTLGEAEPAGLGGAGGGAGGCWGHSSADSDSDCSWRLRQEVVGLGVDAAQAVALVCAPSRSEVASGPRLPPRGGRWGVVRPGASTLLQRQLTKNKLGCQGLLAPGSGEEG